MQTLRKLLADVVENAVFEVRRTEVSGDGTNIPVWSRQVRASELREFYFGRQDQVVRSSASVRGPEALMSQLVAMLRQVLKNFVDPETDRIGHAFPIGMNKSSRTTTRSDGLADQEHTSLLPDFSRALVQAATIMGIEQTTQLLTDWEQGEPVRLHLSTVLNNLFLNAPVSPRPEIRIVPLPLTTTDLPRLPMRGGTYALHYLGLTLLSLEFFASPALFRPKADSDDGTVRSHAVDNINLDLICEVLSLQTNRHVSKSVIWCDYPDIPGFCLGIPGPWTQAEDRLRPAPMKSSTVSHETGVATITLADDVMLQRLDENELRHTLDALMPAGRKLRIAADRWRRSKRPDVSPGIGYSSS